MASKPAKARAGMAPDDRNRARIEQLEREVDMLRRARGEAADRATYWRRRCDRFEQAVKALASSLHEFADRELHPTVDSDDMIPF